MTARPWLVYCYPWMPYPRRIIIYLRERNISSSTVAVVPVTDPGPSGNKVIGDYPPKPPGSLPILAIPREASQHNPHDDYTYIGESLAIIAYLEEACASGCPGFPRANPAFYGKDMLSRARVAEALNVASELTCSWNPVRTFGTQAGTIAFPEGSKEMLRWVKRFCLAAETQLALHEDCRFRPGDDASVTIADIVLYQFLEFTKDCYGVDMTSGTGEVVTDVYGREVRDEFPKLRAFYEAFRFRPSARREESLRETPPEGALAKMMAWHGGII